LPPANLNTHITDGSVCLVLDPKDVARAPIAEIAMPRRVPQGLHGNRMPAAALWRNRSARDAISLALDVPHTAPLSTSERAFAPARI
jgi:hypothetical protein